jgi:hypothetical protein
MNKGGVLFVLLAGGYIVFELSMLHRLGYRMEVDYILDQMVSSEQAVKHCGQANADQRITFRKKLDRLIQRGIREQQEAAGNHPAADTRVVESVDARILAIRNRMDSVVAEQGCQSKIMTTWQRRYTIYAGRG